LIHYFCSVLNLNPRDNSRPLFIFYILIGYIFLQFLWWGYHIISLTQKLNNDQVYIQRRVLMIAGEALVFFIIIGIGVIYVIRSYKKELKLSRRQKNFTLSVTHELKTPIASSKLFLETLLSRELPEEKKKEILQKVVQDQERLQKLVENILMTSQVAEDDLKLEIKEVNAYDLVQGICEDFPNTHQFINNIDNEINLKVDLFYFTSVIQNLFENAQKYSETGSDIIWTSTNKNNQVTISICDQGAGIPDNEKDKVFQLFYRLDKEETRSSKGTGLGLYLVDNIINLHKGEIMIENNKNKGSIFTIKF